MKRFHFALIAVLLLAPCVALAVTGTLTYSIVATAPGASTFDTTRNTNTVLSFSSNLLTATLLTNASGGNNLTGFTTGFHSDTKRFFRFSLGSVNATGSSCGQGVGGAASGEPNVLYVGRDPGSFGIYADGTLLINGNVVAAIGNTGLTFKAGDTIDIIFDPVAKTVQEAVNGGIPSATLSTATLTTQNISPAASMCSTNDTATFSGNPVGVGYNGAIAWDGTAGPAAFSSIKLPTRTFIAGSTTAVGTASATITSGTNSPTWSIKTSGNDSLGTPCSNYGTNFTIGSTSGVVTPAASAPAQSYPGFCPQATQSGVGGSPYSQAFTLTGNAPTPLVAIVTPSSTTASCNVAGGTQVAAVTSSGGDGNPINALSLTAGGTDFALSSTTGLPSNVIVASGGITSSGNSCSTLPTGGHTETVTVQISQP